MYKRQPVCVKGGISGSSETGSGSGGFSHENANKTNATYTIDFKKILFVFIIGLMMV